MRRVTEFARGSYVPAASLNGIQDEQRGLIGSALNPAGARALKGSDGRYFCTPDAGVANGTLVVLEASVNWRSRLLSGVFFRLESAAQRLHGADAWQVNDPSRPIAIRRFEGGTGAGGLGAASATVANGTPPVIAAGSSAVIVDELASSSQRIYLYARPDDGALCLYNASGATLHAEISLEGAAEAPTPGVAPPTPIPTLTNLLWLTPTVYASRPSNPGADVRGVHRSTDTGEVALWDGGAWRVLVSSIVNATQLQGRDVASTAPTNGQTLVWSVTNSRWEPASISSSSTFTQVAAASSTSHAGSGFTGANGNGTATPSTLTLSIPGATTTTGWSDQPRVYKNALSNPFWSEITARIVSQSGGTADSYYSMAIRKADGTVIALVQTRGDGLVSVFDSSVSLSTSLSVSHPFDGTGWFKITFLAGHLTVWQGTGSSTAPTWTPIHRSDVVFPSGAETGTYLTFALHQGGGAGGTVEVVWSDVTSILRA